MPIKKKNPKRGAKAVSIAIPSNPSPPISKITPSEFPTTRRLFRAKKPSSDPIFPPAKSEEGPIKTESDEEPDFEVKSISSDEDNEVTFADDFQDDTPPTLSLSITFPYHRLHCVPTNILGVTTEGFNHNGPEPETQPEFTVWAILNAIKRCSDKILTHVMNSEAKNTVVVRDKSKNGVVINKYRFNLGSMQNCDCVIKQVYGNLQAPKDQCIKCEKNQGAFVGCVTHPALGRACANCDWNRTRDSCSFKDEKDTPVKSNKAIGRLEHKSKSAPATTSDESNLTEANPNKKKRKRGDRGDVAKAYEADDDPFAGLSRETCMLLSLGFKELARRRN